MTFSTSGSVAHRPAPGSSSTGTTRSPSQSSQGSQLSQGSVAPAKHQSATTSSETTPLEKKDSPGRAKLRSWLHALMSVVLSDGRTLVGNFVCTDRDANIILSSCTEHLPHTHTDGEEEARMLGLAMVPGRHVVSLSVDERTINQRHHQLLQQHSQQDTIEEKPSEAGVSPIAASSIASVTPSLGAAAGQFSTSLAEQTSSAGGDGGCAGAMAQSKVINPPSGYT